MIMSVNAPPPSVAENANVASFLLDTLIAPDLGAPPRQPSLYWVYKYLKFCKEITALMKDPYGSSHSSWHLWLPPHFNNSLGMQYVQRQKQRDKKVVARWSEWIQGSNFCFNEGAIIYDRDVSNLTTWDDRLKAIDFYVVLGPTQPVSYRTSGSNVPSDKASGNPRRNPGSVKFKVYVPTGGSSSSPSEEHSVSQDQFVRYAITGSLES